MRKVKVIKWTGEYAECGHDADYVLFEIKNKADVDALLAEIRDNIDNSDFEGEEIKLELTKIKVSELEKLSEVENNE